MQLQFRQLKQTAIQKTLQEIFTVRINMLSPENKTKNYSQLFNDIDKGLAKIPQFQRDFVWEKRRQANDSKHE